MADPGVGTERDDLTTMLGTAIRERRRFLRISQEELAVRSGLHRTYLSDVECGARNPSIKTIEKIAHALQVPVVKLFEESASQRK
jgi:transcriptional regulator with XRE-family HTH domain